MARQEKNGAISTTIQNGAVTGMERHASQVMTLFSRRSDILPILCKRREQL